MKRLIDLCYTRACELLTQHQDKLTAVAEALLDRDTLNRAEFEMVMRGEELPPKTEAEKVQAQSDMAGEDTLPFDAVKPESQEDNQLQKNLDHLFGIVKEAQENGEAFIEPEHSTRKQLEDSWAEFERSLKENDRSDDPDGDA